MNNASYWIKKLALDKHPEGGYYKEIYRSDLQVSEHELPTGFKGNRNFCTAIYYLLEKDDFSAFHRLKSDEIWHFYAGSPLKLFVIQNSESIVQHTLGNNDNSQLVAVIPKDHYFAAKSEGDFTLIGCTVSPGFDFHDFELANKKDILHLFPQHHELISLFTR